MRHFIRSVGYVVLAGCTGLTCQGQERKADKPAAAAALPLAEVVLYSSGVGYFQRDGQVQGNAQVELRFKVDNINDLLKSLVVLDFDGGRVSTVTYGSRDPLTKTLKSFGIDLTSNPSVHELLGQIRGERIELEAPVTAQKPIVGTILGVEKKTEPAGDNKTVQVEYLNLLTESGLQSIPFARIQKVKLLNEQLNGELQQALEVLAAGHDTQKKTVSIKFDGEGKRKVSVAYIAETPVWKTSYRLVLDDEDKPFLQGWAIVENTTDDDWDNVRLSLISGRPISFMMDMYQPLYVARPVVVPELYASLRPQTYGEAMEERADKKMMADARKAGAPPAAPASAPAGGAGGGFGGMVGGRPESASRMRRGAMAADALAGEFDRQQLGLDQGVASAAEGAQTGELFEYAIKTPISLGRQKSAMLPIVSEAIDGRKVSIYNQNVHGKFALNGFRLKNTSKLNLMQGPITVFDGGAYAGDARIDDIAPAQERLISYAMDLKTEVEPIAQADEPELVTVQLKKGTLIATRKAVETRTYNVKNRDQKKKLVLVEHPFRSDWTLVEPSEPTERTRDVYRFALDVDAEKGGRVNVKEERQVHEHAQVGDIGPDMIAFYVRAKQVSPKVKEALQKVAELRNKLGQTAAERGRREQRINEITQEQGRIRENMARLAQNSELYNRYVKKFDEQETEIENVRKEIETLKKTEAAQQKDMNDYLMGLDVS